MKNKLFALLVALLMTVGVAGNAMADFAAGHLIRVVYDSVGAKEYATDLGSWASVSTAAAGALLGGGVDAFTLDNTGAVSVSDLYVGYYLADATTGANQAVIAGDANGLTSGARKFSGFYSNLYGVTTNYAVNMIAGTNSALLADKSAKSANTFFNKAGNSVVGAGDYGGWVTAATNPGGVLNLAPLSTTGYVDQTLYTWTGPNLAATGKVDGAKAFTVRTMADGSTVIGTAVAGDTVPPVLTLSAPVDGLLTNNASVSVAGTATDAGGIGSVTVNGLPVGVGADGFFTFPTMLVAGLNTFTVVATDNAGNSSPPVTRSVILDQVAPVLTVVVPDTGLLVNYTTFTFAGNATDAGGEVTAVTVNGLPVTLGVGGLFSTNVMLAAGTNSITTVATDKAGNSSTVISSVTLDTVAPVLTVASPVDGLLTSIASVSVTGTATDAGGVKSVTVNGLPAGVGAGGFFTFPTTLVAGLNTFTVVATDNAGNSSLPVTRTVILDQVAPLLTVVVPDTGLSVNYTPFTFTGNATDAGSEVTGVTVNGLPVTVGVGGLFSTNVTLVAGANSITAVATDKAGNTSTVTRSVTLDTVAPVLTVAAPLNGLATNNASLAVTGTATDTGSDIKSVTVNGQSVTVAAGAFSTSVTLVAGANTITVIATDGAGNHTTVTRSVTMNSVLTVNIQGTGAGSVNSIPLGINCLSGTCQAIFNPGAVVSLTAIPNGDSVVSWSDACAGCTGKSCDVSVTGGVRCGVIFSFVKPARIGTTDYDTLQAAYDAAADGSNIMVRDYGSLGTLNSNLLKKVVIKGGYNQTYTQQTGFSDIMGVMTIRKGSVIIERVLIK